MHVLHDKIQKLSCPLKRKDLTVKYIDKKTCFGEDKDDKVKLLMMMIIMLVLLLQISTLIESLVNTV